MEHTKIMLIYITIFIFSVLFGLYLSLENSVNSVQMIKPTLDNYKNNRYVDDRGVCYRYIPVYQ